MEIRLDDRTALITGGSRGLGRAMARAFADAGADVAIVGRSPDALAEAATHVAAAGQGRCVTVSADVRDPAAIASAHRRCVEELGDPDILVNNAVTSATGAFLDLTDEDWQNDLDLKFLAAVRLIRLCLPRMQERGWGRIINVLNTAAKAPPAKSCPTSVSRAAGMAMTKALSAEVAGDGVLVNALNTGVLVTHQWHRRHQERAPEATFDEFIERTGSGVPIGRMGDAEEFAAIACFLASDAASYITGTAINVDGGLSPVV